jgi:beta-glucanase (GH16 family)
MLYFKKHRCNGSSSSEQLQPRTDANRYGVPTLKSADERQWLVDISYSPNPFAAQLGILF